MASGLVPVANGFFAADEEEYKPLIVAESNEGQLAMSKFQMPENFKAELFAAEPMLANPVAFCIDEQGAVYVAETFRQSQGVEDNRSHMYWIEDEYKAQKVEDRAAMIRKHNPKRISHYTKEHDRIRKLVDTDGNGSADQSTVYADGFNDILDGTGAGLMARNGEVFYTCIPKLWKFNDSNNDGKADNAKALHHGYGITFSFRGHDMHGLIMGPDGRVYFSIGDRGYNVETMEGTVIKRVDTGGVFRCNLDGTELEEFAFGLRNPQELAFDDYGNLFTGDNNSDLGEELARWVYVCEAGDSGWRMPFQYLGDRGPWNQEAMWLPLGRQEKRTPYQPAYIVPPVDNISDGPSGLAYYPGVGLSDRYKGHFFLCDFRATDIKSGVHSLAVEPKGAGFEMVDAHRFLWNILVTDVDFGYDGKVYASDWVHGWNGEGKGRIYAFSDEKNISKPEVKQTTQMMKAGFDKLSKEKLIELLNFVDRRIRQEAQFELVKRNAVAELAEVAANGRMAFPRIHAIWGLGQLSRVDASNFKYLIPLLDDSDQEISAQAAKMLGDGNLVDAMKADAEAGLLRLLETGTARGKYFAAMTLGKIGSLKSISDIARELEANNDSDAFLRHGLVQGLVRLGNAEELLKHADHDSVAVRRGIVLALRRMKSPEITRFLKDEDRTIVLATARAINDEPIEAGDSALAAAEWRTADLDPLKRRIMNANFRVGQKENAEAILKMANDGEFPTALREEAMNQLLFWGEPPFNDRVTNSWRPQSTRDGKFLTALLKDSVTDWVSRESTEPVLRLLAIQILGKYKIDGSNDQLKKYLNPETKNEGLRLASLKALENISYPQLDELLLKLLDDRQLAVRSSALTIYSKLQPEKAVMRLDDIIEKGNVKEKQTSLEVLANIEHEDAFALLKKWLTKLQNQEVESAFQLDVLNAAKSSADKNLNSIAMNFETELASEGELGKFRLCMEGGNKSKGAELFKRSVAASCRRCHIIDGDGGKVGPDLTIIGKQKNRQYLIESIVLPNKEIAKGFESAILILDTGRVATGIVKKENEETLTLELSDKKIQVIDKESILNRQKGQSGMPADLGKNLSLSEIRDIVEYLANQVAPSDVQPTETE